MRWMVPSSKVGLGDADTSIRGAALLAGGALAGAAAEVDGFGD
jgi:hypothetical protein